MDTERTGSQNTLSRVLGDYAQADCARFHMPGHKGRGMGRSIEGVGCGVKGVRRFWGPGTGVSGLRRPRRSIPNMA